jgi:cbb3-type cytochrome oxidase subunit 3
VKRPLLRKKVFIPLYVSIGTVFIVITVVVFVALTWYNYREGSKTALETADRIFGEITEKVQERMKLLQGSIATLADAASAMPAFVEGPAYDGL